MPQIGAERYGAIMGSHPRRPVAVFAAILAALWAFVMLPPQLSVWSGAGAPAWSSALDALPVYDGLRLSLASAGVGDLYAVFGAAASVSFVLIWWATGPTFARLGWTGRVLGWLVLCSAPITVLSYLNHPTDAPLHALWGAEGFALLVTGLWAVFAGVAPRAEGIPAWERALIGSTLAVMVVASRVLRGSVRSARCRGGIRQEGRGAMRSALPRRGQATREAEASADAGTNRGAHAASTAASAANPISVPCGQ